MRSSTGKRSGGFTLVELLIVMVVISILSAIAIPSYRQHVLKVRRSDGQTALTSWAQRLERCYTRDNAYNNPTGNTQCTFAPFNTQDATYQITANIEAQTYTLTATPLGYQSNDTRCATLTINETGQQTASGTDGNSKCW